MFWNLMPSACLFVKTRSSCLQAAVVFMVMLALIFSPSIMLAAPQNGQVVSGQAAISQAGKTTNIDQNSQKAAINWQKFSINVDETVNFRQPNAQAVILNRVIGNERSIIDGALTANGHVFLVNSAGIIFNKTASVKAGGIVASALDINQQDFEDGRYVFSGSNTPGQIINKGSLQVSDGGYAVLLGGEVVNEGIIVATAGTVSLNSAKKVTLNFSGSSLAGVTLDEGALNALVENREAVYADGGKIILTARAADNLFNAQVNNAGIIRAQTLEQVNGGPVKGAVTLAAQGGEVKINGQVDVSAPKGGDGGTVVTSGRKVILLPDAKVSGWSAQGKKGQWELEQTHGDLKIGAGAIEAAALKKSLNETDITLKASGPGSDLVLAQDLLWVTDSKLTLKADHDISILAALAGTGAGAYLELSYGLGQSGGDYNILSPASFSGTELNSDNIPVAVKDTSGGKYGEITLTGNNARLLIDGEEYSLIQSIAQLIGISGQDGYYALARNLTADQTYDNSLVAQLTGSSILTGLGHTIKDLTIITPGASYIEGVGMIGLAQFGSFIRDLGLLNVNIDVQNGRYVGGLIGQGQANLYKVYTSGNITGNMAGGLVGFIGFFPAVANNSSIKRSFSSADIQNLESGDPVGGLVGRGQYFEVYNSHATGDLTTGYGNAGGLIGYVSDFNVYDSYATGDVTSLRPTTAYSTEMGGLIGYIANIVSDQTVVNSFATGDVLGGTRLGGLIGRLGSMYGQGTNFIVENCYATGQVTSQLSENIITGDPGIGGLIGSAASSNYGDVNTVVVRDSFATGDVKFLGTMGGNAGGLIGNLQNTAVIERVYATGDVTISGTGSGAGGLIGVASGVGRNATITDAYATGDVTGTRTVGGFIGTGSGTFNNIWSSGNVVGSFYVGGLMGTYGGGTMTNAHATGSVTNMANTYDSYTGGLVGYNGGSISDSYATGAVVGQPGMESMTGGLLGYNRDDAGATVSDSYYNSEANSGLNGVGNSDSSNINNIVGLDNNGIDSQFGEQIQQGNQQVTADEGRLNDAASSNLDALNEADANAASRGGFDSALNDALSGAESEWQAGQSDRNAAADAPGDPWRSEIESRDSDRQTEISQIEAAAAAQVRAENIQSGLSVNGDAKLAANEASVNAVRVASGPTASADPSRAGEFITGADLNGMASDTYRYGVEQMDVEGRSFTTASPSDSSGGSSDSSGGSSDDDEDRQL